MNRVCRIFLFLCLLLVANNGVAAEPPMGRVIGKINCSPGECTGLAALWMAGDHKVPAPDRYQLVPAVVSALQEDGSFELLAPVGEYFIGGQLRTTPGPLFGAPRVGDRIYLVGQQDEVGYRVQVEAEQVVDIGLQKDFWIFNGLTQQPDMGISGQVINLQRQPVEGLLVFAFADPGTSTTPLAISSRTGKDGRFQLPLAEPGEVYLRARKNYRGGQPQAEDYVGVSIDGKSTAVIVKKGQLVSGIEVQVRKLPGVLTGKNAPDNARPQFN